MPESHYYDSDTFTPFLKDISGNTSIIYKYDASYSPLAEAGTDYHTITDSSYVQFHNQIFSISTNDTVITHVVGKDEDASYKMYTQIGEISGNDINISGVPFIGNYSKQTVEGTPNIKVLDLFEYVTDGYSISPINSGDTYVAYKDTSDVYSTSGYPIYIEITYTSTNIVNIIEKDWTDENYANTIGTNLSYNEPVTNYKYRRIHDYTYPATNVNNIVSDRLLDTGVPRNIGDELIIAITLITTFTYTNNSETTSEDTSLTSGSYSNNTLKTIVVGIDVTSIADGAFLILTSLLSVTFDLGSKIETIGVNAFNGCSSLNENIIFPSSLTSIGSYAFYNCSSLTSVTFEEGSQLETIGSSAFKSSGLDGTISLPGSLESIGAYAFESCSSLTVVSFELGSLTTGTKTIGSDAFQSSGVTTINAYQTTITAKNWTTSPQTIGGKIIIIINLSPHTLFTYNNDTTSNNVLATINFSNDNSILKTINIGTPVTSISNDAFKDCSTLTSVSFESGIQLPTIGQSAFRNSGLTGPITLPVSLTSISNYVFYQCSNLTSVTFESPSVLTTIGESVFEQSGINGSITLPASLTSLQTKVFYQCSNLTSVTFGSPSVLTTIGLSTFNGSGLESIALPASVTNIGDFAFYQCSSLTSVTFGSPSVLTTIGTSAFNGSGLGWNHYSTSITDEPRKPGFQIMLQLNLCII